MSPREPRNQSTEKSSWRSSDAKTEIPIPDEIRELWIAAEEISDPHVDNPSYQGYICADYAAIYECLYDLRRQCEVMIEWGSGLGVVAIMASKLGYEAYGIEAELELVLNAERLAQRFNSSAQFAQGNFIPDDFEWSMADGDEVQGTLTDVPDGYDKLDMELRDFDLIYAYPWPGEHLLFHNIIRQHGRRNALLLSYDIREGIDLVKFD